MARGTSQELATVRSYLAEVQVKAAALAKSVVPLEELKQIPIPESYAAWRSPGIYQLNLRHLVEQLRP